MRDFFIAQHAKKSGFAIKYTLPDAALFDIIFR